MRPLILILLAGCVSPEPSQTLHDQLAEIRGPAVAVQTPARPWIFDDARVARLQVGATKATAIGALGFPNITDEGEEDVWTWEFLRPGWSRQVIVIFVDDVIAQKPRVIDHR